MRSTGYVLQYSDSRGADNSLVWNSTGTQGAGVSSFTFAIGNSSGDLAANSSYYFRVIAYDNGGNAPISDVANVATTVPTSVTAAGIGSSQVAVNWSDSTPGITSYDIWYSISATSGFSSAGSVPAGNDVFDVTGLSANTQYYF